MQINPSQPFTSFLNEPQKIHLLEGQSIKVEPTAMLACKNLQVKTGTQTNVLGLAARYFFGGESVFQNLFTAKTGGGWISFEEELPGQIASYTLEPGMTLTMSKGSFVAADSNVKISVVYGGITGWWKGVGFAKLKANVESGAAGRIYFDTVKGVVKEIKINPEDGAVIVDNNNTVAHSGELTVTVRKLGGVFSTVFSGEGTVNEFRGKGSVFVGSGEKDAAHNVFDQIVKGVANAIIPSKTTAFTLVGLYVVLNSELVTRVVIESMKMFGGNCSKGGMQ